MQPPTPQRWHLQQIARPLSGKGVTVAVVDTGIDGTHPNLLGRVASAYTMDFSGTLIPLPAAVDPSDNGHGTFVAGLICSDAVGVAPDARLASVEVPDRGTSGAAGFPRRTSRLLQVLNEVAKLPEVRIVNLSLGIKPVHQLPKWERELLREAIRGIYNVGKLVVMAVGNQSPNAGDPPDEPCTGPWGVMVGMSNAARAVSPQSKSGPCVGAGDVRESVPHLVAPGERVWSCDRATRGLGVRSGTSFAAPIVSGVAALWAEYLGVVPPALLRTVLLAGCSLLPSSPPARQGRGLVQVPTYAP